MILYSLACRAPGCGHAFESWFSSSAGYERLHSARLLSCPTCGGAEVSKALMAPSVPRAASQRQPATRPDGHMDEKAVLRDLRRRIEADNHDVGDGFADEARRIHAGTAPARGIYGNATPDDEARLRDEGIPVIQVPWVPLDDA